MNNLNTKLQDYINKYAVDPDSVMHLERFVAQLGVGENCTVCGASMRKHKHTLTPMLVNCLLKMRDRVTTKGDYKVHISTELGLTNYEYNNFQKLRYFGLIAKDIEEGVWILTTLGGEFCSGNKLVPKWIKTFRNHEVERSREVVKVGDIVKQPDYMQKTVDFRSKEYWTT